mgnify:CR=1 FL=1
MKFNQLLSMSMRFSKHKYPGETIVEVLVSVSILSIVMTGAFVLFQQAIGVNVNIRNRVAALSIAQEGVEAVRSLRDVNWMRFSGDRRRKWLCTEKPCDIGANLLENGFYRVYYGEDGVYALEFADAGSNDKALFNFDASTSEDIFAEIKSDEPLEAGYYLLRRDVEVGNPLAYRYTHAEKDSANNTNEESIFYRQLYLQVQNPYESMGSYPTFCDADDDTCNKGALKIYSLVYWEEEGLSYDVQIEAYLFDYFQRKSY